MIQPLVSVTRLETRSFSLELGVTNWGLVLLQQYVRIACSSSIMHSSLFVFVTILYRDKRASI